MKRLLLLLSIPLATSQVMAQKNVYQIRADSVRIYSGCDTAELIIENGTKDTLGFLFNKGNGRTEFRKLQLQTVGSNAIAITGQDTLQLGTIIKTAVDTIYTSGNTLYYRKTDGKVYSAVVGSSETLQSVMARNPTTTSDIHFLNASNNPSNGLKWEYNTDTWKIFAEAPQDDPPGNLIFLAQDNINEGWIFRHDGTGTGGIKVDILSIGRDRLKYKGNDVFHGGNLNPVRGGTFETTNTDWNSLVNYSFVGSVNGTVNGPVNDGAWWNVISTRHRNGASDGTLWGLQIANGMTAAANQNRIFFRSQTNTTWTAWKEFWHTANLRLNVEADSSLAIESWLRVPNRKGIKTVDGAMFYQPVSASWAIRPIPATTAVWLELQTGNGVGRGSVYASSNNEIGFTGPSGTGWRLRTDASGNASVTGQVAAIAFVQTSLRSLKRDINPFTANATDILKRAQVRTFIYKADSTNTKRIGFIADEVPDEMAASDRSGVNEANTVALLVKALQEMNAKVAALEQEVKRLKEEKASKK
jgi:uncharacterized small protein (DUF1192 family)